MLRTMPMEISWSRNRHASPLDDDPTKAVQAGSGDV
jgi:hypothetical protein